MGAATQMNPMGHRVLNRAWKQFRLEWHPDQKVKDGQSAVLNAQEIFKSNSYIHDVLAQEKQSYAGCTYSETLIRYNLIFKLNESPNNTLSYTSLTAEEQRIVQSPNNTMKHPNLNHTIHTYFGYDTNTNMVSIDLESTYSYFAEWKPALLTKLLADKLKIASKSQYFTNILFTIADDDMAATALRYNDLIHGKLGFSMTDETAARIVAEIGSEAIFDIGGKQLQVTSLNPDNTAPILKQIAQAFCHDRQRKAQAIIRMVELIREWDPNVPKTIIKSHSVIVRQLLNLTYGINTSDAFWYPYWQRVLTHFYSEIDGKYTCNQLARSLLADQEIFVVVVNEIVGKSILDLLKQMTVNMASENENKKENEAKSKEKADKREMEEVKQELSNAKASVASRQSIIDNLKKQNQRLEDKLNCSADISDAKTVWEQRCHDMEQRECTLSEALHNTKDEVRSLHTELNNTYYLLDDSEIQLRNAKIALRKVPRTSNSFNTHNNHCHNTHYNNTNTYDYERKDAELPYIDAYVAGFPVSNFQRRETALAFLRNEVKINVIEKYTIGFCKGENWSYFKRVRMVNDANARKCMTMCFVTKKVHQLSVPLNFEPYAPQHRR